MSLTVRPFTGPAGEWDAFVRAQAGWTAFHLHAWRSIYEDVSGHEALYLEARDAAGLLVGVLPLVRVKSLVFGHYLVSLPFVKKRDDGSPGPKIGLGRRTNPGGRESRLPVSDLQRRMT